MAFSEKQLLFFLIFVFAFSLTCGQTFNTTIRALLNKIKASQIQETTHYFPFVSEEKFKGLFPSYIHLNFHGDFRFTLLRREFKFFVCFSLHEHFQSSQKYRIRIFIFCRIIKSLKLILNAMSILFRNFIESLSFILADIIFL
jgi:hypothetical protein